MNIWVHLLAKIITFECVFPKLFKDFIAFMIINYTSYVNTWILIVHNICMQMY
jgi:hypothetical protein